MSYQDILFFIQQVWTWETAICIEVKLNVKVLFIYLFNCGLISEVLQRKSNSVQFDSSLVIIWTGGKNQRLQLIFESFV